MRKLVLLFAMCFALMSSVNAQQAVTGTVTGDDGSPLPGVTVVDKGTTNGTTTDANGNYSINVPSDATLVFTFVGMEKVEEAVNGRSAIDVTLSSSTIGLDEVVVTALGIERQEKTLTYAQQSVDSEELVRTRDINFVNSLSGKAAGVEIKKSSSGAGGSTRIVLRGNKSLSGDSEPLFVVDGIPMVNNKGGQPGMWGGIDQGDGISQLNPDDIESISILKGSNSAVLYGSQGANGVVLITTKSGKAGETKVSISSGITFEDPMLLPELQYKYGSEEGTMESWSYTSGNYDDTFVDDFFQTGHNLINTVTVSGGNQKTTAYFSYANTSATGITPNNKYGKNNITFKQSTKFFNDKVTASSNVMLSDERSENRNPAGYYLNPLTALYFFPRDKNFDSFKENYEIFNESRNLMLQNWFVNDHFQSNPYWIINNEPKTDLTKRAIASANLSWDITDKLNFAVRGNYDYSIKSFEQQHYAGSNSTNTHENGRWDYRKYTDELIYADGILKYDDSFGAFTVNAIAGGSYQKNIYGEGVSVNTDVLGLLYPNEFYFQNLPFNVQVASTLSSRRIKQGLFANVQIGFKEMLFLDFSGRNDWASTLAGTGNDSYFYPAFGLTALFSEMIEMPDFITFSKVRASQTTVANEVPFNRIDPQNTITGGGGVSRNTTKPFTNLKPEMIRSTEIGTDWRFFTGRFGFDLTYYHLNSTDQFISLPAPSGSGYTRYFVNAGKIVNKGVELTLDVTPVRRTNFSWNSAFNFSRNINEVVETHPELTSPIGTGGGEGYDSKFVAGGSIGDVYVYKFLRDDQGRIMLDDNGAPRKTATTELIGNLNSDWSLGWNNNITMGNFGLSFLINSKVGGVVVSQTEAMLDGYGVSKRTADARDNGGVDVNAVDASGSAVNKADPQTWYSATGYRNGIKEPYVYDKTNVRLGQFALSYMLDLAKLNLPLDNANLSLVGQNLFFIYKEAPFDPELAMSTNRNNQSLDNFNTPTSRTIGFNIKINF